MVAVKRDSKNKLLLWKVGDSLEEHRFVSILNEIQDIKDHAPTLNNAKTFNEYKIYLQ